MANRKVKRRGPKTVEALRRMLANEIRELKINPPEEFTGREPTDILTLVRFDDGHVHGIYPDDDISVDMLSEAMDEFGLDLDIGEGE